MDAFVYIFVYNSAMLLIFNVYCGETGSKNYDMIQFHYMPNA